ncbi:MAG: hypothetical protein IJY87_05385 [Bacilli bacterium]|nr:hypothetical protein [Bacilli bacterium]
MNNDGGDKIGAIVKLGLWLIFIAVLMIIARFGGTIENTDVEKPQDEIKENESNNKKSYEHKLKELVNNYAYTYEIKVGNDIYTYIGNKMIDESYIKESGYIRKNNEQLYNYFIDNGYSYQVNNGGLDKVDTIYDVKIDANYLDVSQIKSMIHGKEYVIENENNYIYNLDAKKIIIVTNEESVTNIEVIIGEDYYKLEISGIGLVKEIKY